MVDNPIAAQITLQFALNTYKASQQRAAKRKLNPHLNLALESLAKLTQ